VGFGAGYKTRDAGCFGACVSHQYSVKNEVPAPHGFATVPVRPRVALVPQEVENNTYLPVVGNQGTIGACAAFSSTYYVASALWRQNHPGSWLRFSPRYPYDHYSDSYSGGQDAGSWPDQDLEVAAATGIPTYKQFPYGTGAAKVAAAHGTTMAPYGVDNPIPAWAVAEGAAHRFQANITHLSSDAQGGGPGLIQAMEQTLAQGGLIMAATSVPPAFDQASPSNPYIDFSTQDNSRGDHEITFYGYKLDPAAPGGGWLHFRNSWTKFYGLNGDAWYSFRSAALFLYGVETMTEGAVS
jgi:C1A family cysteine protease